MESAIEQDITFLGFCDRANYNAQTGKWNILGLGYEVYCYIFPYNLSNIYIGINISENFFTQKYTLRILDHSEKVVCSIDIGGKELISPEASDKHIKNSGHTTRILNSGRAMFFLPLDRLGLIQEPGIYSVECGIQDTFVRVGSIEFILITPPTFNLERKTAIKSDPEAAKSVNMTVTCKKCQSNYQVYAGLERDDELEEQGLNWFENIPDSYTCECGETIINLKYIRTNLHSMLGTRVFKKDISNFIPLYEKSALKNIRIKFAEILNDSPKEESLQIFIKENPILLHQFPASMIIEKPPILSKHVADFAILTAQKELIFIEIEKPSTKLMKINGHRASDLVHAFDQVRDWLQVIDEHRLAILDDLDIDRNEVSVIRGVVIAGRERGYDAQKLRHLKMSNEERISFLTYDDLLFALDALINKFDKI